MIIVSICLFGFISISLSSVRHSRNRLRLQNHSGHPQCCPCQHKLPAMLSSYTIFVTGTCGGKICHVSYSSTWQMCVILCTQYILCSVWKECTIYDVLLQFCWDISCFAAKSRFTRFCVWGEKMTNIRYGGRPCKNVKNVSKKLPTWTTMAMRKVNQMTWRMRRRVMRKLKM